MQLIFFVSYIRTPLPGFWDYGHELFKSTPKTFPAAFIAGDVFDPALLAPADPADIVALSDTTPSTPAPFLADLRSLNPLRGKVSAIFAGAFFHLFDDEKQRQIALRLAALLSPEKGSVIFGEHGGLPVKGFRPEPTFRPGDDSAERVRKVRVFCHSPESWREMWMEQVFGGDGRGGERVRVDVDLVVRDKKEIEGGATGIENTYLLNWCITRL